MIIALRSTVTPLLIGVCLLCSGCCAPRYTSRQLVLFGKTAPPIAGPNDPAIQTNLSVEPGPKLDCIAVITGLFTTPFKSLGLQGWKDYQMHAEARGIVVQHGVSSDRLLTVDVRLGSLAVNGVPIPISDERFIRLEIFLGKVSVDKSLFEERNAGIVAEGKFVWDTDGWFEIHPQKNGDVRRDLAPDSSPPELDARKRRQTGTAAESAVLLPALLDHAFQGELQAGQTLNRKETSLVAQP